MSDTEITSNNSGLVTEEEILRRFADRVEAVEFVRQQGDVVAKTIYRLKGPPESHADNRAR